MDLKKLVRALLFPPVWLIIVLSLFSTAALIFIFIKGLELTVAAYIIYVVAFYSLSVLCLFFSRVFPRQYREIKSRIYSNPLGNRYMTDAAFRTGISLYTSLCLNLFYTVLNIISFLLYRSMWFICLAVYYFILAAVRLLLARYTRLHGFGENLAGELRRTVLCSYILLTVNFALSGSVLMILYRDKGSVYDGIMIYIMAAYTFFITAHAITGVIKYRRYNSPAMLMTKVISLSAALVSMLSLETAMLSQFGQDMSPQSRYLMIALTGAGVSVAVIAMSVYMIVRSSAESNKLKEKQNGK